MIGESGTTPADPDERPAMRRPSNRLPAVALLAFTTFTACTPQPGAPLPTGSISPNPVPLPTPVGSPSRVKHDAAEVTWTGLGSEDTVTVSICRVADTDPTFVDAATSCTAVPEHEPEHEPGSDASDDRRPPTAGRRSLALFRGRSPGGGNWGCYAPGDVAPPGVELHTTCFVRLTSGDDDRQQQQQRPRSLFVPFTIVDEPEVPDPVVPDLPAGPALTVGASALAVAFVVRKRRAATGAAVSRSPRVGVGVT